MGGEGSLIGHVRHADPKENRSEPGSYSGVIARFIERDLYGVHMTSRSNEDAPNSKV